MRCKALLLFISLFSTIPFSSYSQENSVPVQQQLDAYNARDLEAFLGPYSDTVKIYNHPNKLMVSGKDAMRVRYGDMFTNTPDLLYVLLNRMVLGDVVIDQEYVIREKNGPRAQVIAMYTIKHSKIQEVYFIKPNLE